MPSIATCRKLGTFIINNGVGDYQVHPVLFYEFRLVQEILDSNKETYDIIVENIKISIDRFAVCDYSRFRLSSFSYSVAKLKKSLCGAWYLLSHTKEEHM